MLTEKQKQEIASLTRRKNRELHDAFIIEGFRSVDAALASGAHVNYLISTSATSSTERNSRATTLGGVAATLPYKEMAKISDVQNSQGVLLVVSRPLSDADELLNKKSVLLLDGIQDPGNVGTLLRIAAWFGIDGVLAGPETADFFNPKVVRASMGGIWDVQLARTDDLVAWCSTWSRSDGSIYAADLDGLAVDDWVPTFPSVLIVGSEAHGISENLESFITERIHVPSRVPDRPEHSELPPKRRATESLNVAAAGAVVISNWVRQAG
ncbi:MAG: RNA methyltransferase [Rhodothermia bacterium]|nr:MAG: RNA methyltransferase [Rhodothermia bacterium]